MSWRKLLEPEIQNFMIENARQDLTALALKKNVPQNWPYPLILDQMKVRAKAIDKTPELCNNEEFIFPPNSTYEQVSSQACALYKAGLVSGKCFVDLTAGGGIDSFYLARKFERGELVERDLILTEILAHNAELLRSKDFLNASLKVHQVEAEKFILDLDDVDLVYIDPQRRETNKKGIMDFKSCSPDITVIKNTILNRAGKILVKASPVLDITMAIQELGDVSEVHVVGWNGDCKEVLYIIDKQANSDVLICAVEIDIKGEAIRHFKYRSDEERKLESNYSMPLKYIYEPTSVFQKAGGYNSMAQAFSVSKLHPHSHLYTSNDQCPEFTGRAFEVVDIIPAQAKALKITQAEISVRNFPQTTENLRKKLKLIDGGNHRIFATTLMDGSKKLVVCKKIS